MFKAHSPCSVWSITVLKIRALWKERKQKSSKRFTFSNSVLEKMTWEVQWYKVRYKKEHIVQISACVIDFLFPVRVTPALWISGCTKWTGLGESDSHPQEQLLWWIATVAKCQWVWLKSNRMPHALRKVVSQHNTHAYRLVPTFSLFFHSSRKEEIETQVPVTQLPSLLHKESPSVKPTLLSLVHLLDF